MSKLPKINVIVALDKYYGIAKAGTIPWNLKADMKWFKNTTQVTKYPYQKNAMIMGRKTFETLKGKPLVDRYNVVVTSTMNQDSVKDFKDTYVKSSLKEAISFAAGLKNISKIFAIGGGQIYKQTFDLHKKGDIIIDNAYITHIDGNFNCDTQFTNLKELQAFEFDKERSDRFTDIDLNTNKETELLIEHYRFSHHNDYRIKEEENKGITSLGNGSFLEEYKKIVDDRVYDKNGKLHEEYQYLDLLSDVLNNGESRQTRNAITKSIFGRKLEFNLENGFPLLTTKKTFMKGIFWELMFFLSGRTSNKWLSDKGVHIWDKNSTREFLDSVGLNHYDIGTLGPIYWYNILFWGSEYKGPNENYSGQGINQFADCLSLLRSDPYSRRILLTCYNPTVAKKAVLYPCHSIVMQFYVNHESAINEHKLSCTMYQRSADGFLGLPFNIASTSLLLEIMCQLLNNDITYTGPRFKAHRVILMLGDIHLYDNHFEQVKLQLSRKPHPFPKLEFKKRFSNVDELTFDDILLKDYDYHPAIKAEMVA